MAVSRVTDRMRGELSEAQWREFQQDGYTVLGSVVSQAELAALQRRIDDIMLGKASIDYGRMLMQLDRDPASYNEPGPQTNGHKGATLGYRKIQNLELDPLFLEFLQAPLFRGICARVYGADTRIACNRAMFMNKPAREGTTLGWHQDRWIDLDRDPVVTVWLALDPATVANGCVHVTPGRHRELINPEATSGFLTPTQVAALLKETDPVPLELAAGEAVLLHNHLPHSSGTNSTEIPRRAFSVCYMDAATRSKSRTEFPVVFGDGALTPFAK